MKSNSSSGPTEMSVEEKVEREPTLALANAAPTAHNEESEIVVKNGNGIPPTSVRLGEDEEEEEEQRYGWSKKCSPDSIQCLRNKKIFLVIFCLTCVVQGMFSTYFVAIITTLEKLFSIHSKTIGALLAATEIGQVTSSLFLPYFVGNGHRPRWIGIGAALFSIASLLCASPHFLIPIPAEFKQFNPVMVETETRVLHNATYYCSVESFNGTNGTCHLRNNEEEVTAENNSKNLLLVVFSLSLLTIGLGQTAVYTLGIPYLDDNVTNKDSPLYFSITIGVKILGPVLGFVLGSLCTRLYVYPNIDPGFGTNHIHWLGAWWLGMVLISILLFVTSLLMFGFPAKLTSTKPRFPTIKADAETSQKLQQQTTTTVATSSQNQPLARNLRNFPLAIKRLILNRMLVLRTFSSVFHLLPISGLYVFLPKYLENQFRLAAHEASMITAVAGILVMGIGIFASGVYIRKYGPVAKTIARWTAICAFIYACGMFLLTLIGCDDPEFVNSSFGKPDCGSRDCMCSDSTYSPVCGADGKTYFSPCFAGCPTQYFNSTSEGKKFEGCSCVGGGVGDFLLGGSATEEFCKPSCVSNLSIYLILFVSIVLVHSTSEVGSMLLTLRCVEPRDKAMALGLIQASIGIFGNVPCPILYGAIVDYTCILWGKVACAAESVVGHCWIYDSKLFRQLFHGTTGSLMLIAFLIDVVVYINADAINLHEAPPPTAAPAIQPTVNVIEIPKRRLSKGSIKSTDENGESIPMLDFPRQEGKLE